jgi:hypothetical protein
MKKVPADLKKMDERNDEITIKIRDNFKFYKGNREEIYKNYSDRIMNVDEDLSIKV